MTSLEEKIDKYHTERMSASERDSFEQELASDPSIRAESEFQESIIEGLKDFRKAELKNRLNAVDLSPAWFEFAQQSTLMKSFGGIAVATLIGTGVYLLADRSPSSKNEDPIEVDHPQLALNLNLLDLAPYNLQIKEPGIFQDEVTSSNISAAVTQEIDNENSFLDLSETAEEGTSFEPIFNAPEAELISDEEALKISQLDVLPETTIEEEEAPLEVDYEISKNLDIKYKYYDGKLFLSGDFDRAPYEILEINSAQGRRIYVKYLNKFYQVNTTDRLTRLPEVKNVEVIKELELLRVNK
ncbi:MAG: hypothetical protein AAF616_09675 [Bacteroidota bacterium]